MLEVKIKSKEYFEGYSAGLWAESYENPHPKDSKEHKDFSEGFDHGRQDWDLGMDDGG